MFRIDCMSRFCGTFNRGVSQSTSFLPSTDSIRTARSGNLSAQLSTSPLFTTQASLHTSSVTRRFIALASFCISICQTGCGHSSSFLFASYEVAVWFAFLSPRTLSPSGCPTRLCTRSPFLGRAISRTVLRLSCLSGPLLASVRKFPPSALQTLSSPPYSPTRAARVTKVRSASCTAAFVTTVPVDRRWERRPRGGLSSLSVPV